MSNTQGSSSHGKLTAVVVAAAVVIILAVLSAFVWPGWAIRHDDGQSDAQTQQTAPERPKTPSIDAVALPEDATELLKAMPDSVLNFARTAAAASTSWGSSTPLEEYTMTYSTGQTAEDVTLIAAQWSTADAAKTQYDALAGAANRRGAGLR